MTWMGTQRSGPTRLPINCEGSSAKRNATENKVWPFCDIVTNRTKRESGRRRAYPRRAADVVHVCRHADVLEHASGEGRPDVASIELEAEEQRASQDLRALGRQS